MYTRVIYIHPSLWLTRNFLGVSWLSMAEMQIHVYHTLPCTARNPRVLGLNKLRTPHETVWSTCHVTLTSITTTTIIKPFSCSSSRTATGNPSSSTLADFPTRWTAIVWNKSFLVLREFDADDGGYWKQNISFYLVMVLKMLLIIKGWSMRVIWWVQTTYDVKLYSYLYILSYVSWQYLWQHHWHNVLYSNLINTADLNHPRLWRTSDANNLWVYAKLAGRYPDPSDQWLTQNLMFRNDTACMSILLQSTKSRYYESGWKKLLDIPGTSFNIQICHLCNTQ